jgi:HK97 family phage major capsid protein
MPNQMLSTDSKDFASATAGSSTGSYLVSRTLLSRVIDAARQKLMLRGLSAMYFGPSQIPGSTLVLPLQEQSSNLMRVSRVGQAGEFPLAQTTFESLTLTPVKYGARIGVTKEMIEDGIVDLATYHAELAGYEFALNEESLIVSQLDAASTASSQDVANGNASLPVSDITEAMQYLEAANFLPTDMIVGVEIANDLRNLDTFTEADKSGVNNPSNRLIGKIYGMNVMVSNSVSAKLAYVIDRSHAFVLAEKRPLTIERYDDFARDVGFVVASQRFAASYLRSNAVSEITTT